MKLAAAIIALVLLALIVPFFLPGSAPGGDLERNLPWRIEADGQGGSAVFGLRLGASTLADARRQLGDDVEIAIIAAPDEIGALEAYYAQVPLGFVLGRVIVTADLAPEAVRAMRERAVQSKYMESSTRKYTLHPDDLAAAWQAPVRALSVIPSVNLDEATIVQRFGAPAERLAVSETRTHLLYPAKGLDIVLDSDGKELLQYVAPRDFERLRQPLAAGTTAAASGR